MASARATSDCEVIVIDEESLRALVIAEAELSETIMRAFILRRVAFIQDQSGGILVIGSAASAATFRLRHFLSRNGQPSAYFDIVEHQEAQALLERNGATEADIPVVITLQGHVLKSPTHRAVADAVGLSPDKLNGERFDVVVVGAGTGRSCGCGIRGLRRLEGRGSRHQGAGWPGGHQFEDRKLLRIPNRHLGSSACRSRPVAMSQIRCRGRRAH